MHYKYNTPEYRRLYRDMIKRWDESDLPDVIEERVLELCKIVHASNQGVSIYSCEGHDDPYYDRQGYVMFAARNREAASKLLEVLQVAMAAAWSHESFDPGGDIECCIATLGEDVTYPCIVIRSSCFDSDALADDWWSLITKSVYHQLQHHIAVSPVVNKAEFV